MDLGLDLDLDWRVGLRLGLGRWLLLLLQEDLVVQKLQLSRVQFGFSQHWWWLFAEKRQCDVFIRATGCLTLFILLILRQFEVHAQTNPGTGVFVVCLGACL